MIRVFRPGGRPVVWGARTTRSGATPNWQYVNIRRLFLYLEESIQEGISWAVFEPNNLAALAEAQADDHRLPDAGVARRRAVRRDRRARRSTSASTRRSTRSPSSARAAVHRDRRRARRIPAEFIVVRIGIWDGGARDHRAVGKEVDDATTATRVDPYGNYNFLVEIDGITPRRVPARCSGLRLDASTSSSTARAATQRPRASCRG